MVLVSRWTAFDRDACSAFDGGGLGGYLHDRGSKRLWVGGLAEDVCVRATVNEACDQGFETHGILPVTSPEDPDAAKEVETEMREAGAVLEGEA